MEYKKFNDTYVIRLDRGEEVISSLTEFCKTEHVTLGTVQALGASDHIVIGLYHVDFKQDRKRVFEGPMEITSLLGNISTKDGEPHLHLHINLCRDDMSVIGGHLIECRISSNCEMIVRVLDGLVERMFDDSVTGLDLFNFV